MNRIWHWTEVRMDSIFYRKLAQESGRYLVPGGSLLFEIGYDQGNWAAS